jgi:outer membrane protein assembly factor BamB
MNTSLQYRLLVAATLVLGVAVGLFSLGWWLCLDAEVEVAMNMPGMDGRPEGLGASKGPVDLAGVFETFDGQADESMPGAWPRFRGADLDNVSKADTPLADTWPTEGPEVLWSVTLGEGHAAPAIFRGRVYLIDYDEEKRMDAIRCFSLKDGQEIWRRSYKNNIKRNHGMSRTVPAVTDDYLITIGPRCHVVCLDPVTGDFKWGLDLQRDFGTEEPLWYTGQCPLIEDGKLILAPSGPEVFMMAVDCANGETLWTAPNPKDWKMSHSSIVPMTFSGRKMYVYAALGGVAGIAAEGPEAGALLWSVPWNPRVAAPSPLPLPDGRILFTASYGYGSMMVGLTEENGAIQAETLFHKTPKEGIAAEQQTPILYNDLLYAIMPKDAGGLRGQLACYRPDGTLQWSSGQTNRFGLGPFVVADKKIYLLNDDGTLCMIDAEADEYRPLAQAQVLNGHDAWGPLAPVGGRLLLRDSTRMICIDIGEKNP